MNLDQLRLAFGETEFGVREASATLGISAAATRSVLSDMRRKGNLQRVARGRYKIAAPSNRPRIDELRTTLTLQKALHAPIPVALDGPEAIQLWTNGRYIIEGDPDAIYIAVAAKNEEAYREYLAEIELPIGEHRGPHVILRALPAPKFTTIDDTPVIDRTAILELIKQNPVAYEGAEEWVIKS